jgi:hypothetical protein
MIPYTRDGMSLIEFAKRTDDKQIIDLLETKSQHLERWKTPWEKKDTNGQIISTNPMFGYHQTNTEVLKIIESTSPNEWWFLAGASGMCGPGIYFAKTQEETNFKALQRGPIIKAELLLGNPFEINNYDDLHKLHTKYINNTTQYGGIMDSDIVHLKLQKDGYDSVIAYKNPGFLQSGNEYIVYSTEQAHFKETVYRVTGGSITKRPRHSPFKLDEPWVFAVRKGDLNTLKRINIEELNKAKWCLNITPLMLACARGHLEIVEWLIQQKINLQEKDVNGQNALFYAMRGGHKEVVQRLIDHQINLFVQDAFGHFALNEYCAHHLNQTIQCRDVLLEAYYGFAKEATTHVKIIIIIYKALVTFYKKTGRLLPPSKDREYVSLNTMESYKKEIERFYTFINTNKEVLSTLQSPVISHLLKWLNKMKSVFSSSRVTKPLQEHIIKPNVPLSSVASRSRRPSANATAAAAGGKNHKKNA